MHVSFRQNLPEWAGVKSGLVWPLVLAKPGIERRCLAWWHALSSFNANAFRRIPVS
jgi:hypothetical protein